MNMRRIVEVALTTCIIASPAFAQSDSKAQPNKNATVTATGCVVRESDYRSAHGHGKGGFGGLGDQFVLVEDGCNAASTAKAYRLTGKREDELKPFVGKRIEVTGSWDNMRDAKIAAGQEKAKLPPEIKIATFHEATAVPAAAPAIAAAAPPAPEAPPVAAAPPAPAAAPAAPAPESVEARNEPPASRLPNTASNLPLVGLIGLLSLAVGLGLRLSRFA